MQPWGLSPIDEPPRGVIVAGVGEYDDVLVFEEHMHERLDDVGRCALIDTVTGGSDVGVCPCTCHRIEDHRRIDCECPICAGGGVLLRQEIGTAAAPIVLGAPVAVLSQNAGRLRVCLLSDRTTVVITIPRLGTHVLDGHLTCGYTPLERVPISTRTIRANST